MKTSKKVKYVGLLFGVLVVLIVLFVFAPSGIEIGFRTKYDKDMTDNTQMWGGYRNGETYRLSEHVFLEKQEDRTNELVLVPPRGGEKEIGGMLWEAPSSLEQYRKETRKWPQVIGTVDKGTIIRVNKCGQQGAWLWGSSIYVFAEILDGEYSGRIVDISDLSLIEDYEEDPYRLKPDPRVLEVVVVGKKATE